MPCPRGAADDRHGGRDPRSARRRPGLGSRPGTHHRRRHRRRHGSRDPPAVLRAILYDQGPLQGDRAGFGRGSGRGRGGGRNHRRWKRAGAGDHLHPGFSGRRRSTSPPWTRSLGRRIARVPGSETILVVDDETEVRQLISKVLNFDGYLVLEATGGGGRHTDRQGVGGPDRAVDDRRGDAGHARPRGRHRGEDATAENPGPADLRLHGPAGIPSRGGGRPARLSGQAVQAERVVRSGQEDPRSPFGPARSGSPHPEPS